MKFQLSQLDAFCTEHDIVNAGSGVYMVGMILQKEGDRVGLRVDY